MESDVSDIIDIRVKDVSRYYTLLSTRLFYTNGIKKNISFNTYERIYKPNDSKKFKL